MTMTMSVLASRRGWTIGVVLAALVAATAQAHAVAQEALTVRVFWDLSVVPGPAVLLGRLVETDAVRQELKLTEAQEKELEAIDERQFTKVRQSARDISDRTKMMAARQAIFKEAIAEIRAILKPDQWERLDQIQLQAQGPLAFAPPRQAAMASAFSAGPFWAERLKLSDDQANRIRAIVEEGTQEIDKAASFSIPVDPKAKPSSMEDVGKLLDSPGYQEAREKALRTGREAVAAVLRRIEEVLTEPQRRRITRYSAGRSTCPCSA